MTKPKLEYRDVSTLLQMFRSILLGRAYTKHGRFYPGLSSRTIPAPDIPRAPEDKYADQWYNRRSAMHAVRPAAVAPIAEGPPPNKDPYQKTTIGGLPPDSICFHRAPTPGPAWWFDGHNYYECAPDPPPVPPAPPKPVTQPAPGCK